MKKCYLVLFVFLMTISHSFAQTYPGYRTSNYTGVNGVFFNPANIADNRFKWDVSIFGVNGFIGTSNSGLRFSDITHSLTADSLKSKLLRGNTDVNSLAYVDILGPSVMISLTPKTSIAITTRTRVFANGRDIDGNLAGAVLDGGKTTEGIPFNFNNVNMLIHATGWTDIGASVGQVFTEKGSHHFFKGGLTIKYLAGTADSYLTTQNLTGTVAGPGNTYMTNTTGNLSLNTTAADFSNYKFSDFFKFNGHGVGGDIGFVYEWRPVTDYPLYETDRFINKYKLKISASLMDVGSIKFDKSTNSAASYVVNIPPAGQFPLNQFHGKSIKDYKPILDASPYFTGTNEGNSYHVNLPTTIQASVDYMFSGSFAVNASGQFSTTSTGSFNLYYYNSYSITPRYEKPAFSVSLPLNYNELTKFNAGISFRYGPVFIGSGSVITALIHDSKQADFHIGVHFGMPYKKKIRDTDKDGILDDVDKCPTVPGLARYQGCPIPDTDGDGINDEEDSCKTVPGVLRYHGCPVPDTDGDGVNDEEDSCKTIPGPAKFHGCPDTDGDGIPDNIDKCPLVPGVAKYQGCPPPDRDHDGVPDDEDLCPDEPGPVSTHGCPVEKIVVKITADFKNILFDYNKATIRPESDTILQHAAQVMNSQIPNSNFYIDGYTDSKGSVAINKKISKARAEAVAKMLVDYGVDKSRVIARGFGKDNPICDNKTDAGRQCNRRVEVIIRNVDQKEEKKGVRIH